MLSRPQVSLLSAGLLLTFCSSIGQTFYISLFGEEIRAQFHLSHGEFGGVYTAGTLISAATLVYAGKAADRFTVRLLGVLTLIGLSVAATAMVFVTSVWGLVAVVFGLRLFGQGLATHLALTAMSRWFDRFRGRALSIAGLGLPVGEAILPLAAVAGSAHYGWRGTWAIAAIVLVVCAVPLLALLLRGEPRPAFEAASSPAGLMPDRVGWNRAQVLRDPMFYGLCSILLAPPFILTGLFFHQIHLVHIMGWNLSIYAASFIVFSVAIVGSSLATGWAVDKIGSVRLLPWFLLPMTAGLLSLFLPGGGYSAGLYLGLVGLSVGSMSSLFGALWADLYGTTYLGAIRALVVSLMVASTAVAPGIIGVAIDVGIDLLAQIVVMTAYCLASIAGAHFLMPGLQARLVGAAER